MLGKKRGRKKGSKNKSKLLNSSSLINVDENKKLQIKELIIAGKDRGFLTYAEIMTIYLMKLLILIKLTLLLK